jgi:hypothetical protein
VVWTQRTTARTMPPSLPDFKGRHTLPNHTLRTAFSVFGKF